MPKKRRVRLIGTTIPKHNGNQQEHDPSEPHQEVMFEDVLPDIKRHRELKSKRSIGSRRIAATISIFRKNPAFLVGDAPHIHSPVGGQGMNNGIMDAGMETGNRAQGHFNVRGSEEPASGLLRN